MSKTKNIVLSILLVIAVVGVWWLISRDRRGITRQEHGQKQVWYCPMHPWIKSNKPGVCPICGMALVPGHAHSQPVEPSSIPGYMIVDISPERQELAGIRMDIVHQKGKAIIIPKDAMMDVGSQKIVFIETEENRFEPRNVKTLKQGERIAVSGIFLLNSESQIQAGLKEGDGNG